MKRPAPESDPSVSSESEGDFESHFVSAKSSSHSSKIYENGVGFHSTAFMIK
jgi:hypothetical protein